MYDYEYVYGLGLVMCDLTVHGSIHVFPSKIKQKRINAVFLTPLEKNAVICI